MCRWWILLLLIGFVFLITYDPRKGTIHTQILEGPKPQGKDEPDPLRWKPTSGMYDPVGAIFNV